MIDTSLITASQLAAHFNCSEGNIRKMAKDGKIIPAMVGADPRYCRVQETLRLLEESGSLTPTFVQVLKAQPDIQALSHVMQLLGSNE